MRSTLKKLESKNWSSNWSRNKYALCGGEKKICKTLKQKSNKIFNRNIVNDRAKQSFICGKGFKPSAV